MQINSLYNLSTRIVKRNKDFRLAKRKIVSKHKKKNKNKRTLYVPKEVVKARNEFHRKFNGYKRICVPNNFSLINNPNGVLEAIEKIHNAFECRKPIFVDLKHVQEITMDALVLLLSHVTQFKSHNIRFNGSRPDNMKIEQIIEASRFYEITSRSRIPKQYIGDSEFSYNRPSFFTHAKKNVDSELTANIIAEFSKEIWGEKKRCQGVQRIFIELMQNTNNHANKISGDEYWWLSAVHRKDTNTICFSFIDYGMGIFNSLNSKKLGEKFFGWVEAISAKCNPLNHYEVLEQMLLGNFHRTVTGKYYRGKGLPGIYEQIGKGGISKLVIISNDAYADASVSKYYKLQTPLMGTFVYFEIDKTCKNLPYIE